MRQPSALQRKSGSDVPPCTAGLGLRRRCSGLGPVLYVACRSDYCTLALTYEGCRIILFHTTPLSPTNGYSEAFSCSSLRILINDTLGLIDWSRGSCTRLFHPVRAEKVTKPAARVRWRRCPLARSGGGRQRLGARQHACPRRPGRMRGWLAA